jgi:hypothetical protein
MLSARENYCPDQVTFSRAEPSHPTTAEETEETKEIEETKETEETKARWLQSGLREWSDY